MHSQPSFTHEIDNDNMIKETTCDYCHDYVDKLEDLTTTYTGENVCWCCEHHHYMKVWDATNSKFTYVSKDYQCYTLTHFFNKDVHTGAKVVNLTNSDIVPLDAEYYGYDNASLAELCVFDYEYGVAVLKKDLEEFGLFYTGDRILKREDYAFVDGELVKYPENHIELYRNFNSNQYNLEAFTSTNLTQSV